MAKIEERLKDIIDNNEVVLFMKGTRMFPQCGFSARSVEIFKRCDVKFKDVNVLADPEVRQGIKDFSNWPTVPQAYIKGEFVGGSDILLEMYESGELHKKLGIDDGSEATEAGPPQVTVTKTAREKFTAALADMEDEVLRFDVTRSFTHDLFFGPKVDADWQIDIGDGLIMHISKQAGVRANGVKIDFVDGPDGQGFKIDNPNAPPAVKPLSAKALKAWLDNGDTEVHLFDVRGDKERTLAKIDAAKPLDADGQALLDTLAKHAKIVLHCHHGVRSKAAAQQLINDGFTEVYSLTGGIDAWSATIDDSVPRY